MEFVPEIPKLMQSDKISPSVDFNETKWKCVTSKAFLACYFEHIKEEDENRDGTIRSNPADGKKLTCSPEEYQQSFPILWQNTWHTKLCECDDCIKMYEKQNVNFQFVIKTIEWLPTEILLKIFTHLVPSDRRIASECCKRFLDIWLCDDFADDRRLVFDFCVLDPAREPLSTFLKSSRSYRNLVIGDAIIINEMSEFIEKFGETITTLDLKKFGFKELFDERMKKQFLLLSQLPNLKTLKVNAVALSKVSTESSDVVLVISDSYDMDYVKCYLDKTPNSCRIELNVPTSTHKILTFTESQRNKIQRFELHLKANDKAFKLPRFNNLKCLELVYNSQCAYGTEQTLENLEEQLPALKDLSIFSYDRLPHKNWTCLKKLEAWYIPKAEISRLSIFENMKELTLRFVNVKCYFVHETFLNKNLKTLKIANYSDESCVTCFQTITKSFPALESLTCQYQITNEHLEALANNTPKLKSLELTINTDLSTDVSLSFACLPNLTELKVVGELTIHMIETWPLMFSLRKLNICLSHLKIATVKIFEGMPTLEDLTIACKKNDDDQLALFDALTKPLKRLRKFEISGCHIEREIYTEIVDVIANNCKYSRTSVIEKKKIVFFSIKVDVFCN